MPVKVVQHGEHALAGSRQPVGHRVEITFTPLSHLTRDPVHVEHPPGSSIGQAVVQLQGGNGEHEPHGVRDP